VVILFSPILEERLNQKNYANLDEKKFALQELWNKIPISLCKRLCDSFDARVEQVLKTKGKRVNTRQLKKRKKETHFKLKWNRDEGITRVVYKDQLLESLRIKAHKKYKAYLNKLDVQFNNYVKRIWNIRNFMRNGPTLLRKNKLPQDLEQKFQGYLSSKAPLTAMMRDIHRMNCYEYYDSLNASLKLKCINEREKDLVSINKPESLSYLDETTVANEEELNE